MLEYMEPVGDQGLYDTRTGAVRLYNNEVWIKCIKEGTGGLPSEISEWVNPAAYCNIDPRAAGMMTHPLTNNSLQLGFDWIYRTSRRLRKCPKIKGRRSRGFLRLPQGFANGTGLWRLFLDKNTEEWT